MKIGYSPRMPFVPAARRALRFPAAALIAILFLSGSASAQAPQRIAAVVNDDVISIFDLESRTRLALSSSGLEDSPENRRRMGPQVLRRLIEEKIQLQEAQRLGVTVGEADVGNGIATIERQNRMKPGDLENFLRASGIDRSALAAQIRAEIAWARVARRSLMSSIKITEQEIDAALAEIAATRGQPEYLVGEILLTYDSPGREEETLKLAERLIEQMRGGAPFSSVARQFSQSPSAAAGGDLGWVKEGLIDEELRAVVKGLARNQLSGPIQTLSGIHILLVRDRRQSEGAEEVVYTLSQLFVPLAPNVSPAEEQSQRDLAVTVADGAAGCSDLDALAKEMKSPNSGRLGEMKASTLPPNIRAAVETLPVGKPSQPVRLRDGIAVLMVCGKKEEGAQLPPREDIQKRLEIQRLELAAQRLLRDLRRAAFIDVRI